jgi:hypothetical protein
MKRTPLRRRTPLRARSRGRARPGDPLATWCQAAIPDICQGRATHRHHILPRSAGGTDSPADTADICGACHAHVHAHPAWAYETGWLRRRTA